MLLLYVYTNDIYTYKSSDLWYSVPKVRRDSGGGVGPSAYIIFVFER